MITLDQAKALKHGDTLHGGRCSLRTGPRGSKSYKILRFRVTGQLKLWKRSPEKFELPIKYGLYSYGKLTEKNAHEFHIENECEVLR